MFRRAFAAGILVGSMLLAGCAGEGPPPVAAKGDVAGTVTLDGKPMDEPNGEISFAIAGQAPIRLPIKGGKFEGKAPAGDARVEIRAFRDGERAVMDGKPFGDPVKENYIAEQFNDKSTLTAKIDAAGAKNLTFDVQSKQ